MTSTVNSGHWPYSRNSQFSHSTQTTKKLHFQTNQKMVLCPTHLTRCTNGHATRREGLKLRFQIESRANAATPVPQIDSTMMVNVSFHALLLLCWSSTGALARPRTRGVSSSLNRKLSNGGALPSPRQTDTSTTKRRLFLDAFRGQGGYNKGGGYYNKGGGYYQTGTVYEKVLVKTLVDPDGNVISSEVVDSLPDGYEPPKKSKSLWKQLNHV